MFLLPCPVVYASTNAHILSRPTRLSRGVMQFMHMARGVLGKEWECHK
jgi:hypothetical protein